MYRYTNANTNEVILSETIRDRFERFPNWSREDIKPEKPAKAPAATKEPAAAPGDGEPDEAPAPEKKAAPRKRAAKKTTTKK